MSTLTSVNPWNIPNPEQHNRPLTKGKTATMLPYTALKTRTQPAKHHLKLCETSEKTRTKRTTKKTLDSQRLNTKLANRRMYRPRSYCDRKKHDRYLSVNQTQYAGIPHTYGFLAKCYDEDDESKFARKQLSTNVQCWDLRKTPKVNVSDNGKAKAALKPNTTLMRV